MNDPRPAFTCRYCNQDVPAGVGHVCSPPRPEDHVIMGFVAQLTHGPMSQQEQQGMLIPLPSQEQRIEACLVRIEARLAADDRHAAARITDLNQQLAERDAYIKKLEELVEMLGSSLPVRPA